MLVGYQGFYMLVQIANEDFGEYQSIILDKFSKSRIV